MGGGAEEGINPRRRGIPWGKPKGLPTFKEMQAALLCGRPTDLWGKEKTHLSLSIGTPPPKSCAQSPGYPATSVYMLTPGSAVAQIELGGWGAGGRGNASSGERADAE